MSTSHDRQPCQRMYKTVWRSWPSVSRRNHCCAEGIRLPRFRRAVHPRDSSLIGMTEALYEVTQHYASCSLQQPAEQETACSTFSGLSCRKVPWPGSKRRPVRPGNRTFSGIRCVGVRFDKPRRTSDVAMPSLALVGNSSASA